MNIQVLNTVPDAALHDATLDSATAHAAARCRLCGGALEHTFVDLGMSPLCESFLEPGQRDAMEPYFLYTRWSAGPAFSSS